MQTVFFDLDNTLYDYDAAHAAAYPAVQRYAEANLGLDAAAFNEAHRAAAREMAACTGGNCAAVHNRLIRYQQIVESLGKPLVCAVRMAEIYWSTFVAEIRPFPDAADCLRSFRSAGFRVAIGTNMTADYQFAKLEALGLLQLIDLLVSSEEANAEKPDPRFFALCAKRARCAPAACVFVGDNLEGDALAAQRAGMQAVWLNRFGAENCGGIRSVSSLHELALLIPSL